MKRKYRRLSYEDRKIIETKLRQKESIATIADEIGVCRDTIYKEIARTGSRETYNADTAQRAI